MKRTDFTYGQLDNVLRSLGFTCRLVEGDPPVRRYEHKATGAEVGMPPFPHGVRVLEYHLVKARFFLDQFGIADPEAFEAKLCKAAGRRIVKRIKPTYGQLDKVLRSLGFSCRLVEKEPPTRVYEHKATGAYFTLPPFPDEDFVLEHHLFKARMTLEYNGIADPKLFEAKLRKAG